MADHGFALALVFAGASTPSAVVTMLMSASSWPWLLHIGVILVAATIIAWVLVIAIAIMRKILSELQLVGLEMEATGGKYLGQISDHSRSAEVRGINHHLR